MYLPSLTGGIVVLFGLRTYNYQNRHFCVSAMHGHFFSQSRLQDNFAKRRCSDSHCIYFLRSWYFFNLKRNSSQNNDQRFESGLCIWTQEHIPSPPWQRNDLGFLCLLQDSSGTFWNKCWNVCFSQLKQNDKASHWPLTANYGQLVPCTSSVSGNERDMDSVSN